MPLHAVCSAPCQVDSEKTKNILLEMVSALAETIFLLCSSVKLHRCHAMKALLVPLGIIEMDIFLDGGSQRLLARKFSQIVHLGFQDSPESFHRTIINTFCNPGHALRHSGSFQFIMEASICILKSSVTMTQRVCLWITGNGIVESIKDQCVIIVISNYIGHNPSIIQI